MGPGTGSLAMTRRLKPAAFHYRRMLALLVFGLIHAYLIWDGDILVLYAICGAIVYPFRKLRPMVLLALGLLRLRRRIAVAARLRSWWVPRQRRQTVSSTIVPSPSA